MLPNTATFTVNVGAPGKVAVTSINVVDSIKELPALIECINARMANE
jgi:hypothetical protein